LNGGAALKFTQTGNVLAIPVAGLKADPYDTVLAVALR